MSDMEIARDDLALDAIAAGGTPDVDDDALGLLAALRSDLDAVVATPPVAVPSVVVPLRQRRSRSGTLLALAAAAGIVAGGITAGAVVVADKPGELLYAAHNAILGSEDRTAADVTKLLDDAAGALARGDRAAARRLLARAEAAIPDVPDATTRAALRARLATLRGYATEPTPTPSPTPSVDDHGGRGGGETAEPGDDKGGSDSSGSGSDDSGSGSSGSGSGDSTSGSGDSTSGSGSGGSGDSGTSGSSGSGSDGGTSGTSGGSDDSGKTETLSPDTSGHGGGDDSGTDDHSGSGDD